jgi:quinol monooxygenase YgiN
MTKVSLFVELKAKPGKEEAVAQFLASALPLVDAEPATVTWYAIRFDARTFGIFDSFPDEAGRQAHLQGRVAEALMARVPELLDSAPVIRTADILAEKLSG